MPKITIETRIKRERERLLVIFGGNAKKPPKTDEIQNESPEMKRLYLLDRLIDNAAFMAVQLEDLQVTINRDGPVSEYQNGENQWGTKKSPEVEIYNTTVKNYTATLKLLCDMLPTEGDDPVAAALAGFASRAR